MEMKEFIEKFAEALDDIDSSTITPETKFHELDEWSSLAALSIMAMADEEYDKEISGTDLKNAETIKDLFEVIAR